MYEIEGFFRGDVIVGFIDAVPPMRYRIGATGVARITGPIEHSIAFTPYAQSRHVGTGLGSMEFETLEAVQAYLYLAGFLHPVASEG